MHDDERLNRAVAHVAAALRTPALLKLAQVIFAQLHAGTGRITLEQLRSGLTKLGVDFDVVNARNGNSDDAADGRQSRDEVALLFGAFDDDGANPPTIAYADLHSVVRRFVHCQPRVVAAASSI